MSGSSGGFPYFVACVFLFVLSCRWNRFFKVVMLDCREWIVWYA